MNVSHMTRTARCLSEFGYILFAMTPSRHEAAARSHGGRACAQPLAFKIHGQVEGSDGNEVASEA